MVNPVVRRRHEDAVEDPEPAHDLGVNPELVDQVDRVHREDDLERKTGEKQGRIEDPAEEEARAGLPERRRQVVVLALVVDGVCGPQHRDLMAEAMKPVVAEVPGDRCEHPQRDATGRQVEPGQRHVDQGEILQDPAPDDERQELGEIAERGAQDARAQAVDRVVGAIITAAAPPVDEQLQQQRKQEERHRQRNQVHAPSLR